MPSPFSTSNNEHYRLWCDQKLSTYPANAEALMIDFCDTQRTDADHIQQILRTIKTYNLAFYRLPAEQAASKAAVHRLAHACGLNRINHNLYADADSLTSLQVTNNTGQREYIPYTNRPLSWHTDGYYNSPEDQICGMLLHCARPAAEGGTNLFMDHEIAYILLREADPAYVDALMHPETLSIPANIQNGEVIRPEQSGPVFSVSADGHLHMRYSARQRNVQWRNDAMTRKAERFLLDLWEQDSVYKLRYALRAGEGVICNNVLHCRTGFDDDVSSKRLLYRGRYIDRIKPPRKNKRALPPQK